MSNFPPFHPEWLVTFWFWAPGLRALNPHTVLIIIALLILGLIFLKRRNGKKSMVPVTTKEDEQFRHLLKKKEVIEGKMRELEGMCARGELAREHFESKFNEYAKHLERVKKELLYFT